mmetsp:Transcript_34382/g.40173  ORF Transcript_34382/g.40173 Transcript_34382/m.40173 type:complete len:203 (-) Transcript_34382:512-1120(-)
MEILENVNVNLNLTQLALWSLLFNAAHMITLNLKKNANASTDNSLRLNAASLRTWQLTSPLNVDACRIQSIQIAVSLLTIQIASTVNAKPNSIHLSLLTAAIKTSLMAMCFATARSPSILINAVHLLAMIQDAIARPASFLRFAVAYSLQTHAAQVMKIVTIMIQSALHSTEQPTIRLVATPPQSSMDLFTLTLCLLVIILP